MARFGRVLTAMVTPFDDDGALDLDGAADARPLARRTQGNDGLVVAGTTGEAPTLTDDEKLTLWAAVAEAVTIPVVAGTGTQRHRATRCTSPREASKLGVAGILAVCPYYNRPSQAGIEAHLRAIADGHRPAGDGLRHPGPHRPQDRHATLLRARPRGAQHRRRSRTPPATRRRRRALIAAAPAGFEVYSGDDAMTLPLLAVGAVGTDRRRHALDAPDDHQRCSTAGRSGDVAGARAVNARLLESFAFETGDDAPEPGPGQGDAAPPRPAGRAVPAADGRRPAFVERERRGAGQPATLADAFDAEPASRRADG